MLLSHNVYIFSTLITQFSGAGGGVYSGGVYGVYSVPLTSPSPPEGPESWPSGKEALAAPLP